MTALVLCVDFGSTFTKAALVDTDTGELVGTASHPTTLETDVLDGYDACAAALGHPEAVVLACSSAGGGLRIAVVGNEELVTAEAGRRVALSSGGKVVHVSAGRLDEAGLDELFAAEPDVILLTGGTDGGDDEVLLHNAAWLETEYGGIPVVIAGNAEVADRVAERLVEGGYPYVVTENVLPRIGVLNPEPARTAIREMFLAHVIGGKDLSRRPEFATMVRGATPDVVLTGVELIGRTLATDVVIVDIGGATTDVHSVVEIDPEDAGLARQVVANAPLTRTVEGDLGMRWSAETTFAAGLEAGLLDAELRPDAVRRSADPAFLPESDADRAVDVQLGRAAATLAVRRHVGRAQVVVSPEGRVVERSGKDLREVSVLVGSGGVLRNSDDPARILEAVTGRSAEGWQQPEHPRVVIDRDYVLAAIGLLAAPFPDAASRLARRLVEDGHCSGEAR